MIKLNTTGHRHDRVIVVKVKRNNTEICDLDHDM